MTLNQCFSFVNSKKSRLSETLQDDEGMVVVVPFSHGLHPPVDSEIWEIQVRSLKISTVREIIHLL